MRQGRTSAPEASPAPSSAPSRRCDARWLSRRISSFRARDENRDRGASCPLATQASLPAQTSSSHCLQYLRGAPLARARRGGTRGRHQKGQPRALRAEQPLRHRVLQLRRQLVEQLVVELDAEQALRRFKVLAHAVDGRRRHLVLLEEVAERVRRHLEVVRRGVRVAERVREVRDEVAHEEGCRAGSAAGGGVSSRVLFASSANSPAIVLRARRARPCCPRASNPSSKLLKVLMKLPKLETRSWILPRGDEGRR